MASVTVRGQGAQRLVRRLRTGLTKRKLHAVILKTAHVSRGRLVRQKPRRWTGQTRRAWTVVTRSSGNVAILNRSKVMRFLEKGTRAHGPRSAKMLFVPLTRRAFNAGARGVMRANRERQVREAFGASNRGKRKYVFGRDYILTKRVRGIKALHIVRKYRPFVVLTMRAEMRLHIRGLVRGTGAR